MSILFSIIIPHRNTPTLLQRCLDSIPVRGDVQVVVVDDNSDSEIVDFKHFPQWKGACYEFYLTKEGKGAGYARNIGLDHAKGEWILFADSDDYFYSEDLVKLFELSIPDETNVILYQYKFFHEDGSFHIFPEISESYMRVSYDTNILCRDAVMPWAKMVRRGHLNNNHIRFDEIKWGNDMLYSTKLSLSVDSFMVVPILVYSHEWIPSSLVNKDLGLEMFYKRALLSLKRAKLLQQGGRLNYNVFKDQWFRRVYSIDYLHSIILKLRCIFVLGLKYSIDNWKEFTHKPLYLTRLFVKRIAKHF